MFNLFKGFEQFEQELNKFINEEVVKSANQHFKLKPHYDIYEENNQLNYEFFLPFVQKENIDLRINEGKINLIAKILKQEDNKERKYLVKTMNVNYDYEIAFKLDKTLDVNSIKTAYVNNVLKVTFDKKAQEESQSVKIEIN